MIILLQNYEQLRWC